VPPSGDLTFFQNLHFNLLYNLYETYITSVYLSLTTQESI
jgi:hypothetical protein